MTEQPDGNVYEMLWNCEFCGAEKLLGKTHRFCPSCGAAQNPDWRYFPSDAEKVAVHDHVYHGVDKVCPACGTAQSANAEHCGRCGSPLEGAEQVIPGISEHIVHADYVNIPLEEFAEPTLLGALGPA